MSVLLTAAQVGLNSIIIRPKRGIANILTFNGSKLQDIEAMAVVEERHVDRMDVTDHPVEQTSEGGAIVSDHAYKLPSEIVVTMGWSNSQPQTIAQGQSAGSKSAIRLLEQGLAIGNALSPQVAIGNSVLSTTQAIQSYINGSANEQVKNAYKTILSLQQYRCLFSLFTGKRIYNNLVCLTLSHMTDSSTENSLIITMECRELLLVNTQIIELPIATQKSPKETASKSKSGIRSLQQVDTQKSPWIIP